MEEKVYFSSQFQSTVCHDMKVIVAIVWGSWSHCIHSQETEGDRYW